MKQIKNYIAIFTIFTLMFSQAAPAVVLAEEITPAPTEAAQQETTTTPAPTQTTEVTTTPAVQSTPAPTTVTPVPTLTEEEQERADLLERRARSEAARQAKLQQRAAEAAAAQAAQTAAPQQNSNINEGGNVGLPTTVTTQDANATGQLTNIANNNYSSNPAIIGDNTGAQIVSSGNGADSTNTGAIVTDNSTATIQNNNADINNVLTQAAITGYNSNSGNTGGDSTITTGDANVTGGILNFVNTNAAGVMVSEFNIVDDHYGDIIIDFAAACVYGCGNGNTTVANTGNGSYSDNSAAVFENNSNETTQVNDAVIGNQLDLTANTGNNKTNGNTGGDSTIETGDANIVGSIINLVNNNVAGNIAIAFVNNFATLVGDIILTEEAINNCCGGTTNTAVTNSGNGENSTNTAVLDMENNDTYVQTNDAVINNAVNFDGQTGNNSANDNTGGDSTITTGNVTSDVNVLNIANTNIVGGNMWLAIVNEAGKWMGKIMGAPEGTKFAASQGAGYAIDENGYITLTNDANGPDSVNNAEVQQTNNNTTTQDNTANINNAINFDANTGGNKANENTGGNQTIKTGDIEMIANIINIANTNIASTNKLAVLVVNNFGNWFGKLYTPDHKKETKPTTETQAQAPAQNNTTENAIGGQSNTEDTTNNTNNESNNSAKSKNSTKTKENKQNEVTTEVEGEGTLTYTKPVVPTFKKSISGDSTINTTVSGETKVAGIHADASDTYLTKGNSKIKINLVYVLIAFSITIAAILSRKLVFSKLLTKKN